MALEKLIIEDIVEGTGPGVATGDPRLGSGPHRPQEGRQTPPFDPLCSGLRRGRLSRRHSAQG